MNIRTSVPLEIRVQRQGHAVCGQPAQAQLIAGSASRGGDVGHPELRAGHPGVTVFQAQAQLAAKYQDSRGGDIETIRDYGILPPERRSLSDLLE